MAVLLTACVVVSPGLAAGLDWRPFEGGRVAALPVPAAGKTGFTALPPETTGIRFTNVLTRPRLMANNNLMNGSGVALGDFDGDGFCDIYLCDLNGTNILYRNLGGWTFQDVTAAAGVACPKQTSTGAAFADVNADGMPDLLVNSMGGPNACFINQGGGRFTNATEAAGLLSRWGGTSMALGDTDGDGDLDLYVCNYGTTSILRSGGALNVTYVNGKPVVRGRYAQRIKIIDGKFYEMGEPDVLYLNDGTGRFTPVSWTGGAFLDEAGNQLKEIYWDQSLAVALRDMNGDGAPDLYTCSDASMPDRFWINDGHGRFRAVNPLALRQTAYFSMSCDFADLDRDGNVDFLVTDMLSRQHTYALTQKGTMHPQPRPPGDLASRPQSRRNVIQHARGDGTYAEIAFFADVAASEWTWSCIFLDVDLDGWEDLLISNGFEHNVDDEDIRDQIRNIGQQTVEQSRNNVLMFPPLNTPNLAFHNQHDLTFRETGAAWGFDSKQIANGMAPSDLDGDGDLDLVINCMNQPALVYRNDSIAPRLAVRLRGRAPNTQGIGARVRLLGGPVIQSQEMISGGRYMSGGDPMISFATGTATKLTLEVTWRSGARSVIGDCRPNHAYEIDEKTAVPVKVVAAASALPWFQDVSSLINHRHHEEAFDDFVRQALLPNRLSQHGPGAAWFDVDNDGWDDLILPTGMGGKLAVLRNESGKAFRPLAAPVLDAPVSRDQTAALGWAGEPGKTSLLVGSANYEDGQTNGESVLQFRFQNGALDATGGLSASIASVGPLAIGDPEGAGATVLFVGGRVIPGRYPEPAASRLFRLEGGEWVEDVNAGKTLAQVGLVSGAVWSDLDGDGRAELILACEWGPVRVFKLAEGRWSEVTQELGFADFSGWWAGVTTGDLDGDGRMDIIAGNWGLNSPYRASREHPARLYFGDWTGTGGVDLVEAEDDATWGTVPRRNYASMSAALGFVRASFTNHRSYASATVKEVLGERLKTARELHATTLATTIFFNRGGRFEAVPLPAGAQFAPAFAVSVGDLDGDGNEDVFLSQNFFQTQPETYRLDAGRGLWLRGNGHGNLTPMPGQECGIRVYGEQRGSALADYDGDGRIDLVVTQNGAETKLYHNERARPGLRVRLAGPAGNPRGIGAQMRLVFGERRGPVRELHAGSGYWSQDSAVAVLGQGEAVPTALWVRWPGGKETTSPVPAGAREIVVDVAGRLW